MDLWYWMRFERVTKGWN